MTTGSERPCEAALAPDSTEYLRSLEDQLRELSERNLELENAVVQRGVKLNCAKVTLSRATLAFDEALEEHREVARSLSPVLTRIRDGLDGLLGSRWCESDSEAREALTRVRSLTDELSGKIDDLHAGLASEHGR